MEFLVMVGSDVNLSYTSLLLDVFCSSKKYGLKSTSLDNSRNSPKSARFRGIGAKERACFRFHQSMVLYTSSIIKLSVSGLSTLVNGFVFCFLVQYSRSY